MIDVDELGSIRRLAMETLLAGRGVVRRGSRYVCPCCSAGVSAFTQEAGSLRERVNGYCPRCNSKARHRRVWLHLLRYTDLFRVPTRLLHVSPEFNIARRLIRMPSIDWVGIDIKPRPILTELADLTDLPYPDASFDGILAIHVLEHIADDQAAISEMARVLVPGGWAVVNVPARLDQPTFEDATIVDPAGRRAAFGEPDHHRIYGQDLVDRLSAAGFEVWIDRGDEIDETTRRVNGLTDIEHVFHAVKKGSR